MNSSLGLNDEFPYILILKSIKQGLKIIGNAILEVNEIIFIDFISDVNMSKVSGSYKTKTEVSYTNKKIYYIG